MPDSLYDDYRKATQLTHAVCRALGDSREPSRMIRVAARYEVDDGVGCGFDVDSNNCIPNPLEAGQTVPLMDLIAALVRAASLLHGVHSRLPGGPGGPGGGL